jgi:LmbE family N-acetylglucosaminyl deacetylase
MATRDVYIRPNPFKQRDMPDGLVRRPATVLVMPVVAGTDVERVLVVTAHPDDVDFGAAGTVASWTTAGVEVAYCIVTDGDAGGFDPAVPRTDIAGIRQAEQRAAAKVAGVDDVTFLGYPDGRLVVSLDLRRDIARVIRRFRPERVLSPSPERYWQRIFASHPDHLATGEATLCAVYPDARNPFAHPELLAAGFEPWTVPQVWLFAHPESDVYVETTATIDKKVAALLCHVSQIPDPPGLDQRIREWGAANGVAVGLPEGRTAEAFKAIDT